MPIVISSESQIPGKLLKRLESIKLRLGYVQNLIPGFVPRLAMQLDHLFGVTQVITMWKMNPDGTGTNFSPQPLTSIPPSQAVFAIVDLDSNPKIIFLKKSRDLCLKEEYATAFWEEGLTPAPTAVFDYMGSVHPECPRGSFADGAGFKTTPEAESELGLKTRFFFRCKGANPDAGQLMSAIPYRIAVMSAEKANLDDEGEMAMIKGLILIKPEALFKELDTQDAITQSQIFSFIRYMAYEFNEFVEVLDGAGNVTSISAEDIQKVRDVCIRMLQGPLNQLMSDSKK